MTEGRRSQQGIRLIDEVKKRAPGITTTVLDPAMTKADLDQVAEKASELRPDHRGGVRQRERLSRQRRAGRRLSRFSELPDRWKGARAAGGARKSIPGAQLPQGEPPT